MTVAHLSNVHDATDFILCLVRGWLNFVSVLLNTNLTTRLSESMEQRPSWKANRSSACQEILHIIWNPKVHYRIDKRPSPVPIPSLINLVHASLSYFLMIHFNIIISHKPMSEWSFFLRSPNRNPVYVSVDISLYFINKYLILLLIMMWIIRKMWFPTSQKIHCFCITKASF